MEENQAGITALVTAYARAYHATHDKPLIFNDFLADQFYSAEEHTAFNGHLAGMLPTVAPELAALLPAQDTALALVMQLHNCPITLCRSRFVEDQLDAAISQGVEQYVILGAGFDTYAFRRPDLVGRIKIFEVDHPITQSLKRQRVAAAGWPIPSSLEWVPIDFNRENLFMALKNSSFDPLKKAFFSWLGVIYYLPRPAVWDTLQTIAQLAKPASQIAFDYFDSDAFDPLKAARRVQLMMAIAAQVGEPMKTGLDPNHLASQLEEAGMGLQLDLSPAEIQTRYFQNRTDHLRAFEHLHLASVVVH